MEEGEDGTVGLGIGGWVMEGGRRGFRGEGRGEEDWILLGMTVDVKENRRKKKSGYASI